MNKVLLSKMILLATEAHSNQFDKGGLPYILHCLAVMNNLPMVAYGLKDVQIDEELQCIAIGHDLFEDTSVTSRELKSMGFSDRVVLGIFALTKQNGESYEEYKEKVKGNRDAVVVKMADLMHNSDLKRIKGVTEKDLARVKRYTEFYYELQNVVFSQYIHHD